MFRYVADAVETRVHSGCLVKCASVLTDAAEQMVKSEFERLCWPFSEVSRYLVKSGRASLPGCETPQNCHLLGAPSVGRSYTLP